MNNSDKETRGSGVGAVMVAIVGCLGLFAWQEHKLMEVIDVAERTEMAAIAAQNDRLAEGKASYLAGRWCIIAADEDISVELFERLAESCAKQHKNWVESAKRIDTLNASLRANEVK